MKLSNRNATLIKALEGVGMISTAEAKDMRNDPDAVIETRFPNQLDLTKLDAAALFYDGQWIVLNLE